jgi:hypothetical protein
MLVMCSITLIIKFNHFKKVGGYLAEFIFELNLKTKDKTNKFGIKDFIVISHSHSLILICLDFRVYLVSHTCTYQIATCSNN